MYRQVAEHHPVSITVDASRVKYSRLDDAWEGLKWLLARKPEVGTHVQQDFYIHKQMAWEGAPNITVLYKFDENSVTIHGVLLTNAAEETEIQQVAEQNEEQANRKVHQDS